MPSRQVDRTGEIRIDPDGRRAGETTAGPVSLGQGGGAREIHQGVIKKIHGRPAPINPGPHRVHRHITRRGKNLGVLGGAVDAGKNLRVIGDSVTGSVVERQHKNRIRSDGRPGGGAIFDHRQLGIGRLAQGNERIKGPGAIGLEVMGAVEPAQALGHQVVNLAAVQGRRGNRNAVPARHWRQRPAGLKNPIRKAGIVALKAHGVGFARAHRQTLHLDFGHGLAGGHRKTIVHLIARRGQQGVVTGLVKKRLVSVIGLALRAGGEKKKNRAKTFGE